MQVPKAVCALVSLWWDTVLPYITSHVLRILSQACLLIHLSYDHGVSTSNLCTHLRGCNADLVTTDLVSTHISRLGKDGSASEL